MAIFKAVIHEAEEGGYWAEIPALPGCVTEGETIQEVTTNLKDALHGWMETANGMASGMVLPSKKHGTHKLTRLVEIPV